MVSCRFRCRRRSSKPSMVHKPRGQFNQRVQAVGPEHFGVVSIDCAEARSKFMLTDFFGNLLIPPTVIEHGQAAFRAAHKRIQEAVRERSLLDQLVAIERTGQYHRPVQRFFREAGYDTRLVHPYASKQYRQSADPGNKTDDTDLAAIFRAAVNGFGLIDPPWPTDHLHLQFLSRQRRDLIHKTTILRCQLREVLHAIMPGYAECFPKLWESTVVLPVARHFGSAELIRQAGRDGLTRFLRQAKLRAHPTTLPKILAWAQNAPPRCLVTECLLLAQLGVSGLPTVSLRVARKPSRPPRSTRVSRSRRTPCWRHFCLDDHRRRSASPTTRDLSCVVWRQTTRDPPIIRGPI